MHRIKAEAVVVMVIFLANSRIDLGEVSSEDERRNGGGWVGLGWVSSPCNWCRVDCREVSQAGGRRLRRAGEAGIPRRRSRGGRSSARETGSGGRCSATFQLRQQNFFSNFFTASEQRGRFSLKHSGRFLIRPLEKDCTLCRCCVLCRSFPCFGRGRSLCPKRQGASPLALS